MLKYSPWLRPETRPKMYWRLNVKKLGNLMLLTGLSIMLLACGSNPLRTAQVGTVVQTPEAPVLTPPQLSPPRLYNFQTRLQAIFDNSLLMPKNSTETTPSATPSLNK